MRKFSKAIISVMILSLFICMITGCANKQDAHSSHDHSHDVSHAISKSKNSVYLVNDNSTEELLQYSVTYILESGESITEAFSPDNVLWYTIEHGETVYTDAYTDEIKAELDKKMAVMSLVGTESDDLIYKPIFDNTGTVVGEQYSSKSGQYPAIRLAFEAVR